MTIIPLMRREDKTASPYPPDLGKLDAIRMHAIRLAAGDGLTRQELARRFQVSRATIDAVLDAIPGANL